MKIHDETKVPEFLTMLDELISTHLEIGIFGEDDSEVLMIASVQEFGCQIKVTDKMRNYLHTIGIHLRKDTKYVNIPERSYLRKFYDMKKDNFIRETEKLLEKVFMLELSVDDFFNILGEYIVGGVQKYLTELKNPPLHPATIKNKGSSNPLIDTGRLRQSIAYKVIKN